MHNNTLLLSVGLFFFAMFILVVAMIYKLSDISTNEVYIEDKMLIVLNRVEGVDGPALYEDERIKTSLYNCNKTDEEISVSSNGVFRKSTENIIVVIDPATVLRQPGCQTTIRMSPGSAKDRGLSPGEWKLEGSRSVKKDTETLQTIKFTSESFKVLAR